MSLIEIGTVLASDEKLKKITFKPYIKKIDDSFKSDWNQQYVLGRMDPIATFQRTRRIINLTFDVPAADVKEAVKNRQKMKILSSYLYPAYQTIKGVSIKSDAPPTSQENANAATTEKQAKQASQTLSTGNRKKTRNVNIMGSSPILSIKFANLICDTKGRELYGFVDSFIINPYEDMGFFVLEREGKDPLYLPKAYSVALNFNVIHTQELGWKFNGKKREGPFNNFGLDID